MSDFKNEGQSTVKGIEKLQDCFLFKELSLEETLILASICRSVDKKDGDVIIEENLIGQSLFLIVKGKAEIIQGKGGSLTTVATLKPGDIFGEMSLIEDRPTSSNVVAIGKTSLLKIDKMELERLMNDNNAFALKIYRSFCIALSERLRKADRVIEAMDTNG